MREVLPWEFLTASIRFGLDLSAIAHSLLALHAPKVLIQEDWSSFELDAKQQLVRICSYGSGKPLVMLDGRRLQSKLVNATRAAKRRAAADAILAATAAKTAPKPAELGAAVGGASIEACARMAVILRKLGHEVHVAPFEAETQLMYEMSKKRIDAVLANDTDYLALGCDNVLLDHRRFGGACLLFCRSSLTTAVSAGRKTYTRAEAGEMVSNGAAEAAGGGKKKRKAKPTDFSALQKVIESHGASAILLFSLINNDYVNIVGVGPGTAASSVVEVYRGPGPPSIPKLAEAIFKVARNSQKRNFKTADDLQRMLETSLVMLRMQLVYNADTKSLEHAVPAVRTSIRLLSDTDISRLVGANELNSVDLERWWNGEYDVKSLKLLNRYDPGWYDAAQAAGPLNPSAAANDEDDGANWCELQNPNLPHSPHNPTTFWHNRVTGHTAWQDPRGDAGVAVMQYDNKQKAVPRFPAGRPVISWTVHQICNFLRAKGGKMSGVKAETLPRAQGLFDGDAPDIANVQKLGRERHKEEKLAHDLLDGDGWVEVDTGNRKDLLPVMPVAVMADYTTRTKADTGRNAEIGETRWHGAVRVKFTKSTQTKYGVFKTMYLTVECGRSVGIVNRKTLGEYVVDVTNNSVSSVSSVRCLYPKGSFTAFGDYQGSSTFVPCRQSGMGCSHERINMNCVHEAHAAGSTDGVANWGGRSKRQVIDPNQTVVSAFFEDGEDRSPRCNMVPFSKEAYTKMRTDGIGTGVYRAGMQALIRKRKLATDAHSRSSLGNSSQVGRKLKVECVIQSTDPKP